MRKRVRVAKAVSVPMLINRGLQNDALELRERMLVEAFAGGWAGPAHFDNLADMRDCLMLAAADRDDQAVLALCRAAAVALQNIRVRQGETGRFGESGEELKALRSFVEVYRDFWLRQPVSLYVAACDAMDRARAAGLYSVNVAVQR